MTSPLSALGREWDALADGVADWQVELLRAAARQLSLGYDLAAQRDVEGAREWRDLTRKEDRYAG